MEARWNDRKPSCYGRHVTRHSNNICDNLSRWQYDNSAGWPLFTPHPPLISAANCQRLQLGEGWMTAEARGDASHSGGWESYVLCKLRAEHDGKSQRDPQGEEWGAKPRTEKIMGVVENEEAGVKGWGHRAGPGDWRAIVLEKRGQARFAPFNWFYSTEMFAKVSNPFIHKHVILCFELCSSEVVTWRRPHSLTALTHSGPRFSCNWWPFSVRLFECTSTSNWTT